MALKDIAPADISEHRVTRSAPAIAALPRHDRDTLLPYAWADLDYERVAAALGVPIGTVRSRLNRAERQPLTPVVTDIAARVIACPVSP